MTSKYGQGAYGYERYSRDTLNTVTGSVSVNVAQSGRVQRYEHLAGAFSVPVAVTGRSERWRTYGGGMAAVTSFSGADQIFRDMVGVVDAEFELAGYPKYNVNVEVRGTLELSLAELGRNSILRDSSADFGVAPDFAARTQQWRGMYGNVDAIVLPSGRDSVERMMAGDVDTVYTESGRVQRYSHAFATAVMVFGQRGHDSVIRHFGAGFDALLELYGTPYMGQYWYDGPEENPNWSEAPENEAIWTPINDAKNPWHSVDRAENG